MTIAFPPLRRAPVPEPAQVPGEPPQAAPQEIVPVPEAQPAVPVPVEAAQMTTLRHVRIVVAHAFTVARRRARDTAGREGGWVNALLAGKPPSVAEQREYLRTRAWLPPGHESGIADHAGRWYHRLIGVPGVAAGNAISALCARPFRFFCALIVLAAMAALIAKVA
jgi:hypothetical protein